ncbi:unnamed protein product [Amoebophrya sp. A25]|nr:unnamed protein product [Amoebophrya sp. A25]|eukprot:GSA25T00010661001.1
MGEVCWAIWMRFLRTLFPDQLASHDEARQFRAHRNQEVIKVAKLVMKRRGAVASPSTPAFGTVRNIWRPESRLLCRSAGSSLFGPDARLAKVLVPARAWKNKAARNSLRCRKYEEWETEFEPLKTTLRMISKRLDILRTHEAKCKGKKKEGVKKGIALLLSVSPSDERSERALSYHFTTCSSASSCFMIRDNLGLLSYLH